MPAAFTHHEMKVGGRAEYFLSGPNGEKWSGSWTFAAVDAISSFEADDGDDNVGDQNMPASMKFVFEATRRRDRASPSSRSFRAWRRWNTWHRAWKRACARRCPSSTRSWPNETRPLRSLRTDTRLGARETRKSIPEARRPHMRRLKIIEHISLDGVIQ